MVKPTQYDPYLRIGIAALCPSPRAFVIKSLHIYFSLHESFENSGKAYLVLTGKVSN